ncbi:MAG: endonuclease/exonuclease/phosphatase [Chitinophagaceae bacterium]
MKKSCLLLGILFFATALSLQAQKKKLIAVGFYNLENYYDTLNDPRVNDDEFTPDGANAYSGKVFKKKVDNLSTVIEKMGMEKTDEGLAILGVAEIENEDVLKVLCAHPNLAKRHWKVVHFDSPDERGVDVGLLYNPSLFRVMSAQALRVPVELGDRPTRDILYVSGRLGGEIVHVFVNHWPSRRGGESATREKRKLAASVSKKIIDSLLKINPLTKVILMGDLNDDPINASVTEVLDAKGKPGEVRTYNMYNPWMSFYKQGNGTMAYQDTWGLFDQILVSSGFIRKISGGLQFEEAEIFNRSFMIEKFGQYKGYPKRSYSNGVWNDGYSDHFPTLLYFSVNPVGQQP